MPFMLDINYIRSYITFILDMILYFGSWQVCITANGSLVHQAQLLGFASDHLRSIWERKQETSLGTRSIAARKSACIRNNRPERSRYFECNCETFHKP